MRWYYLAVSFIQIICVVILLVDRKQFTVWSQWAVIVLVGGFFMVWLGAVVSVITYLVL